MGFNPYDYGSAYGTPMPGNGSGGWDLSTDADRMNQQRQGQLTQQGDLASGFAQQAGGMFGQNTAALAQNQQFLQDQARGKNSISAEQLRQGLQQNLATQQSMAAGASPQNQAMAARNAAMNMGQASYGMAGQQAMAGLQERQNAQQALANMLLQQRQQNLQGFLQGNQNAMGAFGAQAPQSALTQMGMGAVGGLAGGLAASDRRLKKDIEDGSESAKRTLEGLKAYKFKYRDEKYGAGEQTGVMAQDLERSGLGHAVVNTPHGKMVDGAKAATSSLALVAALGERVKKLEGSRK